MLFGCGRDGYIETCDRSLVSVDRIDVFHRFTVAIVLCALCMACTGCLPITNYEEWRRQKLIEIYPLGKTTRADVAQKWGSSRPRKNSHNYFAVTRPAGGWEGFEQPYVSQRAVASRKRVGQDPASLEWYRGPDGYRFMGLCYVWYYYDPNDVLIDVEWEYASD
jgi:hypothetical protein